MSSSSSASSSSSSEQELLCLSTPSSCSASEYEELLALAASLDAEEAAAELVGCARYGEVDHVRAILARHGSAVGASASSEAGALHAACANGHADVARLLIGPGRAPFRPNESGNTPLHWAAANGRVDCVRLLLGAPEYRDEVDVLTKNGFGRSALTEGFASKNTELVGLLLEHDSAAEDRLLGGKGTDAQKTKDDDQGLVHEFAFGRFSSDDDDDDRDDATVRVRELPIARADDPFGERPEDDTTGLGIWGASLVAARWTASRAMRPKLEGKVVLELGAGCGAPGLAAAVHGRARSVVLTDANPRTVENLARNVDLNRKAVAAARGVAEDSVDVRARAIDWEDASTWPPPRERADVIVGSDLVYSADVVPSLTRVIRGSLKEDGRFLYVAPDTGRDGLGRFVEAMRSSENDETGRPFFVRATETPAPERYRENPLRNGDEDDYFLHFNELASLNYVLYEFCRE